MTSQKTGTSDTADLRRRAEETARDNPARSAETLEALSPEEIRQTLHDLTVHQIELTMQNEELRRAQTELDIARARYFDLYDLAPVGYATVSEMGLILEANFTTATLLGVDRSALVNKPITRFIFNEDQGIYYLHSKMLFETGEPQACELRVAKRDGPLFWAHFTATAAQDADGSPVCRVVMSDITRQKEAERQQLRDSEEKHRHLFETMTQGVIYQALGGKIMLANSAAERILGATLDQLRGKTLLDPAWKTIREDGSDLIGTDHPTLVSVRTGQTVERFIMGITNVRTNLQHWLSMTSVPLFKPGEKTPFQVIVTFDDITSQRQAELNYQMLFREMLDGFALHEMIFDETGVPADYRFLAVNPAFERMTGFRGEDICGRTVLEVMPGTERSWIETYGKVVLTGKPVVFENYSTELQRYFKVTAFRPGPGRFASIFADITERKRAEEALLENEQKYETLANSGRALIWTAGVDKLCTYFNRVWLEFTGRSYEQELGNGWTEGVHPEDFQRCLDTYVGAFDRREKFSMEYRLRRHDGEYRWLLDDGSPRYDSKGKFIGYIGHCLDITERRETEIRLQQAQKLEAIGTLAGGIAHDFNNLLFPLLGFAELLKEDLQKDSPLQGHIDEILIAARRSRDLVKQILAFGRKGDQVIQPVKIQTILHEAMTLLRATIPTTIEIKTGMDPKCGIVEADPTQIHQIVMNLATNAYHAMEDTGGRLSVTLKQVEVTPDSGLHGIPPGDYALLSVADTGMGIPKDILNKIYDPYFTTKGVGKGTGLGLSVVLGIVKSYQGDIRITSSPGEGTEVSVYLPVMKRSDDLPHITEGRVPGGTENILIVDDEISVVRMESRMLERLGYRVAPFTGSREALEGFRKEPASFDIVITDMTMPHMTGAQLAETLMAIRPDIPIILCTGYSEKINEEKAAAIGVKGLLMKPVDTSVVARMIRKVLDEAKPEGRGTKGEG